MEVMVLSWALGPNSGGSSSFGFSGFSSCSEHNDLFLENGQAHTQRRQRSHKKP